MNVAMSVRAMRKAGGHALAFLLVATGIAAGEDQPGVRAVITAPGGRKPAPEFVLKDSSGKTAKLSKYRGKVVLLDFWATWCTGCKTEIPWFAEFQRKYAREGLAVVGVSMDEDGLDLSPKLRQTVKTQFSANGELCHGNATEVHQGI